MLVDFTKSQWQSKNQQNAAKPLLWPLRIYAGISVSNTKENTERACVCVDNKQVGHTHQTVKKNLREEEEEKEINQRADNGEGK